MFDIVSSDDSPRKQCANPDCKQWYPATSEFFHHARKAMDGLNCYCKTCQRQAIKDYHARLKERPLEEVLASRAPEKRCPSCPEGANWHPATTEYFYRHKGRPDGLDATCKQCKNKKDRAYHQRPETKELKTGYNRTYEARKSAVPGTHTPEQIREQLKRQKYRCYYAACGFSKFEKDNNFSYGYRCHVEHTFPLSRVAGTDIPANDIGYLVLSCDSCNNSKRDKFPWEWPEGGRLL